MAAKMVVSLVGGRKPQNLKVQTNPKYLKFMRALITHLTTLTLKTRDAVEYDNMEVTTYAFYTTKKRTRRALEI